MQITFEQAAYEQKSILRQLLELYLYDTSDCDSLQVNEHGLYGYRYLDHYWTEEGRYAFLLKADGAWAGFALIRTLDDGGNGEPCYSMAEFFVMKYIRRKGVGEWFASRLFDRFAGRWKVGQIEPNKSAQQFWRAIISRYANEGYQEIREPGWDGPIQTFVSAGAPSSSKSPGFTASPGAASHRGSKPAQPFGAASPAPAPGHAVIPPKLKPWDEIRIIAPSGSMAMLAPEHAALAKQRLEQLGLRVTTGKHALEQDPFHSSSVEARIADLHEAFLDPQVKGILAVLGGENANQLLRGIDYAIIRDNPKVFCGFSDITALSNAFYAKAGLVSYSGPNFANFAMPEGLAYTRESFVKCLMQEAPYEVQPAASWSDDPWYRSDAPRTFIQNDGWTVIQPGEATGTIVGGNLCTFNLLQGTAFMPPLDGTLLFLEDDHVVSPETFDRDLQSLIHQPGFEGVRGLVIGRFQFATRMTPDKLAAIIRSKKELAGIPVVAEVDFGHTTPQITFPIGGTASLTANGDAAALVIGSH